MMFPWADGGNLHDLWKTMKPQKTQPFVCWILSQYHGIAEGLREIHGTNDALNPDGRIKGRHGDIKAENILWVKNFNGKQNHLLISDFGLTRFHSFKSQSADVNVPGCSPSYRPPECDLPGVRISPQYDMWTLGCLLLEFLTWYLLGWEVVDKEFTDARIQEEGWTPGSEFIPVDKFFRQYRDKDGVNEVLELKKSVIEVSGTSNPQERHAVTTPSPSREDLTWTLHQWINSLHNLRDCPGFAHDVLKIIHQGLLHPDKTKRWISSKVVNELQTIWKRCESSESYCLDPQMWKGGPVEVFRVRVSDSVGFHVVLLADIGAHQYEIVQIESLNEVIQRSYQQTEAPSPGSLSPVSGATSRASTPPPEHEMQVEGQPRTDPLEAISAALEGVQEVLEEEEPPPGQPPTLPPIDSPPSTQTQAPYLSASQQEATGPSNLVPCARSDTGRSLATEGPASARQTDLSSAPLVGSGDRQAAATRAVTEKKRWGEIKRRARKICCCSFG